MSDAPPADADDLDSGAAAPRSVPADIATAAANRLASLRNVMTEANRLMAGAFFDYTSVDPGDVAN